MAGGKPIEILIDTNVDGVVTGAEKVADSFEEIQDSLKDTQKVSDKAADSMEDDFKDAAKVIDRDLTKALKEVDDTAKATGKTVGKSVKDGTDKASEGLSELGDESKSTAKEAAASFGSIEDAASALQEVAANAFAGFGPAGMAAGILAAAGIGLAISALTDNADKINENKENMLGLAAEIRDVGGDLSKVDFVGRMQDWGLSIQDTKEWFELFQDDAKSGFDMVKEESRKAGTDWQSAFKGAHGTMDDSIGFLKDTDAEFAKLNNEISDAGVIYDAFGTSQSAASIETVNTAEALKKQREAALKNAEATREANRAASDAAIIGKTQNDVLKDQLKLTNDLADSKTDAITSELDLADAQENTTAAMKVNTSVYKDNTKASRDKERAVIDDMKAINDWGQAQVDAGADVEVTKAKMAAQRAQLVGTTTDFYGGRDAADAHTRSLLKIPARVETKVGLNGIPQAEAEVRSFTDKGRHLFVNMKTGDVSSVDNWIRGKQGTVITVDVAVRGGRGLTN